MTYWILTVLYIVAGDPHLGSMAFADRQACDIAEGILATSLNENKQVSGWTTLKGCEPVSEPIKA